MKPENKTTESQGHREVGQEAKTSLCLPASAAKYGITAAAGAVFLFLLFLGAMFWAATADPFDRHWFKVHPAQSAPADCVVILPKTTRGPMPVVIYFHGSGGSLLSSGNDLRQLAEMGIAAVGMDYSQTNNAHFDAQFSSLLQYVHRQPWADTNRIAWLGYSLGSQRMLSYLVRHPDRSPALLARLGGGTVPELETENTNRYPSLKVLLVHGANEEVFPVAQMQETADYLRSHGATVQIDLIQGFGHSLAGKRGLIFRRIGERCLLALKGDDALRQYASIGSWQKTAKPIWIFIAPALLWGGAWGFLWRRSRVPPGPVTAGRRLAYTSAWCVAALLALTAAAQLGLRLFLPHLKTTDQTINIARRVLVPANERPDFDLLAPNPAWRGIPLRALLDHTHLANYNRQLINWDLDDSVYRSFVLSPEVAREADGQRNWRRVLWETFYPRVRKETSIEAAAEIIVTHLRERVTVAHGEDWPIGIRQAWERQITSEQGFHTLYVAALRSCGIGARLGNAGAELWTGQKWQPAPTPLTGTTLSE